MKEMAEKQLTNREIPEALENKGSAGCSTQAPNPMEVSPPKVRIFEAIRGWAALVLAVTEHANVSHLDLLCHEGKSGRSLAEARRLLSWAFLEVSDTSDYLAIAWLEQCVSLGRRSISDGLKGDPPAKLPAVIQTYRRLATALGPEDIDDTIAAGLLGQRRPRSRVWPRGFLARLGLRDR